MFYNITLNSPFLQWEINEEFLMPLKMHVEKRVPKRPIYTLMKIIIYYLIRLNLKINEYLNTDNKI